MPASRLNAFFAYVGASLGWMVLLIIWPLMFGPYADPVCQGTISFGFLPAIMVVPFLVIILYLLTVLLHLVFAFRRRRFELKPQGRALFTADAAFFVPFAALSTLALASVMVWNASFHCFTITAVLVLPWVATPFLHAKLSAWIRSSRPSST